MDNADLQGVATGYKWIYSSYPSSETFGRGGVAGARMRRSLVGFASSVYFLHGSILQFAIFVRGIHSHSLKASTGVCGHRQGGQRAERLPESPETRFRRKIRLTEVQFESAYRATASFQINLRRIYYFSEYCQQTNWYTCAAKQASGRRTGQKKGDRLKVEHRLVKVRG